MLAGSATGHAESSSPAESTPTTASRTYTNPVLDHGNDPWVVRSDGDYYYCGSDHGALFVGKSTSLQTIGENVKNVWLPPIHGPFSRDLWAPELHRIGSRWYIYFAADDGRNENHRMYVLRAMTRDPQGNYEMLGALDTGVDTHNGHQSRWAIDGTVLTLGDRLYLVWSGWAGTRNVAQNLYIAPMSNPWTISGPRVLISHPEFAWEKVGRPLVNEGPTALRHAGHTFIIYSASGSWGDDYCLGRLTLVGADPLDPSNWRKHPEPVFKRAAGIYGPGHASFVNDGRRDWIVYHTAKFPGSGWDREVRIQPFTWADDGSPFFGAPAPTGQPIEY